MPYFAAVRLVGDLEESECPEAGSLGTELVGKKRPVA